MEIKSHAKFLRLSPRKARLVVDAIRGMNAQKALASLKVMPKKAAHEIYKVVKTAIANAEHNFGMKKDDLIIKTIVADQGPTFKRYKPRARGSADTMRRKMTHILVVLESISGAKPKAVSQPKPEIIKDAPKKVEKKQEESKEAKTEPKDIKKTDSKEVKETKEATKKVTPNKPKEKPPINNERGVKKDASFLGGFKSFFRRKDK
ncbi:50S ribosomal protein L22 [bacterium]|nr:50S ribosomal protein L22 [bacterium]